MHHAFNRVRHRQPSQTWSHKKPFCAGCYSLAQPSTTPVHPMPHLHVILLLVKPISFRYWRSLTPGAKLSGRNCNILLAFSSAKSKLERRITSSKSTRKTPGDQYALLVQLKHWPAETLSTRERSWPAASPPFMHPPFHFYCPSIHLTPSNRCQHNKTAWKPQFCRDVNVIRHELEGRTVSKIIWIPENRTSPILVPKRIPL